MKNMNGKIKVNKIIPIIAVAAAIAFMQSCVYPTHSNPDFFEEQQSVWQYLSVFSIFQDRVPPRGTSLSPEGMFEVIGDTLHGVRYTGYYFPPGSVGGGPPPNIPEPEIEPLTGSTVYFGFYEFDDRELDRFMALADYMATFDNIIIDLRFNGGGYISVASEMANEILPYGTDYIDFRYRDYNGKTRSGEDVVEIVKTTNRYPRLVDKNVVVLVSEWSASASEILTSALKDGANARIMGGLTIDILEEAIMTGQEFVTGCKTYGKGIGQMRFTRPGREILSVTFMEIRGVSDRTGAYHRVGIEPDPLPMEYLFEALDIYFNYPDAVDPDVYDIMDADLELYFALRAVEPEIVAGLMTDAVREPASLAKQFAGAQKLPSLIEPPFPPRVIGAFLVNTNDPFR